MLSAGRPVRGTVIASKERQVSAAYLFSTRACRLAAARGAAPGEAAGDRRPGRRGEGEC